MQRIRFAIAYLFFHQTGGGWFCPNQTINEFAHTKEHYPELWAELETLSHEPNIISQGFKWGKTFQQVTREVDEILEERYWSKQQMTIFDFLQEEG